MINLEPKKLLILRILQILTERTDGEHRLRQAEIQEILRKEFYIDIDRRTVRRNIEFLQEAGYDIVLERQGAYLACRNFEVGELRLLIDSVLANRNVCSAHTKDLVEKLVQQGGKYFKNYAKHVINLDDWQKQDSQDYFYNIELFCEAIEKKKQVSFFYNNFGIDKKLHHKKGDKRVVNPYQMLLKNGFYYLLCNYDGYENSVFCRVDKVSEVEVLETNAKPHTQVKGLENGLNVGRISNRLPYMFEGSVEEIVFETRNSAETVLDSVLDWFGKDVRIIKTKDGQFRFSVYASVNAIRFWILQFGKYVKVFKPQTLCETIKSDIAEMQKLYEE